MNLKESYKSLNEALTHGGIAHQVRVHNRYVDSEEVERRGAEAMLRALTDPRPRGFGARGVEGKIAAVRYARGKQDPVLRDLPGDAGGGRGVRPERGRPRVGHQPELGRRERVPGDRPDARAARRGEKGATMRLGAYPCKVLEKSLARKAYGAGQVSERHRHRYEFNNDYRQALSERGCGSPACRPTTGRRDRGDPGPPVVPRLPVPSRVPFAPPGSAPAVPRLHWRGGGPEPRGTGP